MELDYQLLLNPASSSGTRLSAAESSIYRLELDYQLLNPASLSGTRLSAAEFSIIVWNQIISC